MESTTSGNVAKTSDALVDRAADKVQNGIRGMQGSLKDAGDAFSSKVTEVHDKAVPVVRKAGGRARATMQQGADTIDDIGAQARDIVMNTADSLVSYTKKNPMTALALAAATGVVLYAATRKLRAWRD